MRTILLYAILVFLSFTSFSQHLHFAKILPRVGNPGTGYSSSALSIGIDGNKNIYSLGAFSHVIDFDPGPGNQQTTPHSALSIYISKLDSLGNFIWIKTIPGQCHDALADILVNHDGSFFLAGSSWNWGISGVDLDPGPGTYMSSKPGFIARFDQNGNFIWAKELDCGPNKIKSDPAGNLYITGFFGDTVDFDPGPGIYNLNSQMNSQDIFVLKLDSAGNFIWAKQFSSPSRLTPRNLSVDGDANLCLSGSFEGKLDADPGPDTTYFNPQTTRDFYIIKLDSSGSFLWAGSLPTYVVTDVDFYGNIYVNGNFTNTLDLDPGAGVHNVTASPGSTDIFYLKLDPLGNLIWTKTIQSSGVKAAGTMTVDRLGNIFSWGAFTSIVDFDPDPVGYNPLNSGLGRNFLHRMDSAGNLKWVRQFSTGNTSLGGYMAIDAASNVYMTGTVYGGATPMGAINWDPNFSNYTTNDPDYSFFVTKYSATPTPVLNVAEIGSSSLLSVYPNPTERFLCFQKDKSSNVALHLYNGTGIDLISNVLTTQQNDKITLDLSRIPCGTYILAAGKQRVVVMKK